MTASVPRLALVLVLGLALVSAAFVRAATLAEYANDHTIRLFLPTKGAVMPNPHDSPGHLKEDTPALLLSGLGLTDLRGISTLMVEYRGLTVPVTSVSKLHVYVNRNAFTELPEEIGRLRNMEFFYCEKNALRTLPRAFLELKGLSAMYFTDNQFTEIPELVFAMTWLRKLQFSKNQISILPEAIGRLDQLRHFNIAGNQIKALPESIAKLTLLRVCDFSDNPIRVIPESFGEVRIVNQLRVRNTELIALPAGFAKMRATVDITGSRIDPGRLPIDLRSKISTEKPPGSKDEDAIVVQRPPKSG